MGRHVRHDFPIEHAGELAFVRPLQIGIEDVRRHAVPGDADEVGTVQTQVDFAWLILPVFIQVVEPVGRSRHASQAVRRGARSGALIVRIRSLDHGLAVPGQVVGGGQTRRPVAEGVALDAGEAARTAKLALFLDEWRNVGVIVIVSESEVEGQPAAKFPLVVDEPVAVQPAVRLIDREIERLNFNRLMRDATDDVVSDLIIAGRMIGHAAARADEPAPAADLNLVAAAENVAVRQERQHRLRRVEMMRVDIHRVVGGRSDAAAAEVLGIAIEPGGLGVVTRRVLGIEGVVRAARR